ncbi:MAG: polysaccharide biosynthesis tyrosine autokinase [Balneolaceae bacterium]|nr:polysaccharide biosynthesis tyrosine autokinase [Balneolaceae bacterium]
MANDHYPRNDNGYPTNGSYKGEYRGNELPNRPEEDEIDLKRLFYILWGNKWLIIGCTLLFSILAGVIAYQVTPIYQSQASLLISQSQNRYSYAGSDIGSLLSSTYGIGTGSTIANELQILRSRSLAMEMADSLMEERLMRNGRQFPVLFSSYPEDSSMTVQDTVAMRIQNNIQFSQVDREADLVQVTFESPSPYEAAYVTNLAIDVYSQISTRQNRMTASSAVKFLEKERARIENELNAVEARLQEFMNRKKLVQVDAQTEELIKRMADLESRRQEARVKLVAANSAIEQYRQRLNNIKPGLADQYADAVGPNMVRLQYQLAELQIEKMQLLANNPGIEEQPQPPKELQQINQKIDLYRKQIRDLTQNLIDQSDQYLGFLGNGGGNVAQTITELNQKLIELQVEQQQYQAQVDVIDEQLGEQQQFFENLPDNMIELARLKRDVTINEELYLTVSKQYAEMSLWEQTQFGLGKPVDSGYVPEEPVKPNKKLYVLVGFILGGILSVGYIFVREAFNPNIDSLEKLRQFGPPLLAVIPRMDRHIKEQYDGKRTVRVGEREVNTGLVTVLDTVSPTSEAFRRLESNIIYSNPDRRMRSILVTSSTKGEGKTTITSNLGVVLAEAGFSVAILDTDLRRPNVHNMFGLNQSPGIIEILFDDLPIEEAVHDSVVPNLSILTSGKRPPNPSAVTQSRKLVNVLRKLEEMYDYVLVDSAPFGIITDPSALIKEVDGVLLVTKFADTNEAEVKHTVDNLNQINAHIIGSVLSSFDYEKSNDYYYGSQYYYGSYYYRNLYEDYEAYHKEGGEQG